MTDEICNFNFELHKKYAIYLFHGVKNMTDDMKSAILITSLTMLPAAARCNVFLTNALIKIYKPRHVMYGTYYLLEFFVS